MGEKIIGTKDKEEDALGHMEQQSMLKEFLQAKHCTQAWVLTL